MAARRPLPLAALLALLALLASCAAPPASELSPPPLASPTAAATLLRVAGANSMEGLLQELARSYMLEQPGVIIEVRGGGTAAGLRALGEGRAELAMVSRPLGEEDKAAAEPLLPIPIARDGLTFIVNPANPINRLSRDEISTLISGERFRWDDLGWLAGTVDLVSREPGSGDREVVNRFALAPDERLSLNAVLMPDPAAVVAYVAEHPSAIGYVSIAQLSGVVKPLRLDEVVPTLEHVADGSYPLARELLLVAAGEPQGELRRFLEWVTGPSGRAIIERRFLPLP